MTDLVPRLIEHRDNLKSFVAEPWIIRQRQPEVPGTKDRDADTTIDPEDLPKVPPQLLDVVADAADPELAEVGEVLADLCGVEVKLLRHCLRRHRADAGRVEYVQAAQIHRQAIRGEFRDRLNALAQDALRRLLVLPLHKKKVYRQSPTTNLQPPRAASSRLPAPSRRFGSWELGVPFGSWRLAVGSCLLLASRPYGTPEPAVPGRANLSALCSRHQVDGRVHP